MKVAYSFLVWKKVKGVYWKTLFEKLIIKVRGVDVTEKIISAINMTCRASCVVIEISSCLVAN